MVRTPCNGFRGSDRDLAMKLVPVSAEGPRACSDCMSLGTLVLEPQKHHLWKRKWSKWARRAVRSGLWAQLWGQWCSTPRQPQHTPLRLAENWKYHFTVCMLWATTSASEPSLYSGITFRVTTPETHSHSLQSTLMSYWGFCVTMTLRIYSYGTFCSLPKFHPVSLVSNSRSGDHRGCPYTVMCLPVWMSTAPLQLSIRTGKKSWKRRDRRRRRVRRRKRRKKQGLVNQKWRKDEERSQWQFPDPSLMVNGSPNFSCCLLDPRGAVLMSLTPNTAS